MKRKSLLCSAIIPTLLTSAAMAQVVNFHDANNNQLSFPGVGYNELFTGQGAFADPGNNIWNGFGQFQGYQSTYFYSGSPGGNPPWPQPTGNVGNPYAAFNSGSGWVTSTGSSLFDFASGSPTISGNATSSGLLTPITLSVSNYLGDSGLASIGAFAVPNGTPSFLLGESAYNAGTKPAETFVLQNVPAGTFGLYIYGATYDNNGGTLFQVNSGTAHDGIAATLNSGNGIPAATFVEGQNYVIFQNVTPDSHGNITITASPNPAAGVGNTNVAGVTTVNGFQLIFNPPPTAVASTPAQNVFAGTTAKFSFSPAFATGAAFHWQSIIGGVTNKLTDGGKISGSGTTNLTISNVAAANVGLYQCVISTATATNTSPLAPLTLLASTATGPLKKGGSATALGYVLSPGDVLIDVNNNVSAPYNSIPPPFVMGVTNVEDNTLHQYVNFGGNGSTAPFNGPVGFIVEPQFGATVVTGLRLFTASSHPEDDPADYLLEGSADGTNFTAIAGGLLALPSERNAAGGAINITNQVLREITFPNSTPYTFYQLVFTNVVDDDAASNGLQIAELQLLGSLPPAAPGIAVEPPAAQLLLAGATLSARVVASGAGPFTYEWFYNTTPVAHATNATLIVPNVQAANDGAYHCLIGNPYGSTNSTTLTLTVEAPTPYAAAVQADHALAYYPLNETSGTTAADVIGDFDGTYETNAVPGQPGVADPPFLGFPANNASVETFNYEPLSWVQAPFGTLAGTNDLTIPNLTLTCWIYPNGQQVNFAGLIFDRDDPSSGGLDISPNGSAASSQMLGYVWNNNNNDTQDFVSNLTPPQNEWSLVGLTITPTQAVLYLLNAEGRGWATNAIPHANGALDGAWRIGNDADGDPARTFSGMIDSVAIFTNALSPSQFNSLYDIGTFGTTNVPPIVSVPAAAINVDQDGNATISATVQDGPPPFTYQWYYVANGVTNTIPGATNATLSLTDVQTSQGSYQYIVVVSNAYGTVTSAPVTLNIFSGAPTIVADVSPLLTEVPAGVPVTFSVAVTGTAPFTYQWTNGVTAISGATNSSYTFNALPGTNTYTVGVLNADGSTPSSTAVVVGLTNPPPVITFNDDGTDWTTNEGSGIFPSIANNVLTLTDGNGNEATSAFYDTPQYIGGFIASYVYRPAGSGTRADGTTFCIQNDQATINAVGGGGGALGYQGITNSSAFEINLYVLAKGGSGIQFGIDGSTTPYVSAGLVNVNSGDPILVQIYYSQGVESVSLEDQNTSDTFTTNWVANLPAIVGGSSAYIGFTGGDGASTSTQTVANFQFSYTTPPILSVAHGPAGSVVVSWPVSVSTLFVLQQASTLTGTWTPVAGTPVIFNSKNEVTLTPGTTEFYRLSLQ